MHHIQDAAGNLAHGGFTRGRAGQIKIDHRFGPASVFGKASNAVGQPAVIEAGRKKDAFAGKNARLSLVDQPHRPAFKGATHPLSTHHGLLFGGRLQPIGVDMVDALASHF